MKKVLVLLMFIIGVQCYSENWVYWDIVNDHLVDYSVSKGNKNLMYIDKGGTRHLYRLDWDNPTVVFKQRVIYSILVHAGAKSVFYHDELRDWIYDPATVVRYFLAKYIGYIIADTDTGFAGYIYSGWIDPMRLVEVQ